VSETRATGVRVVRGYIARHTEYLDLVAEDMRATFDLPVHV
jgi:hypothetical protein